VETTGTGAARAQRESPEHAPERDVGDALVALLARALRLERAALLMEEPGSRRLVPVAVHGRVDIRAVDPGATPADGPWSATLPLGHEGRPTGMLLLARDAGAPLSATDRALAERLAGGASGLLERNRLRAELAHARALLARADRLSALGTLAAGVAHEIRNPLVSVRAFIQLLPERIHDEEFRGGFRDLVLREIERICALINDLVAFARPTPVEREPTDLHEVIGQIVRLLDPEARKRDVVLESREEGTIPPVIGDEGQVKQVLMNVVLNAIQASGARGRVEVSARLETDARGPRCVVAVADSGPGISPEVADRIFDAFVTTKDSGSGLGLFIAHRIMADHGGGIRTTPGPGGGAVFLIDFPAHVAERSNGG
jgi:signal transduction histidine kinase